MVEQHWNPSVLWWVKVDISDGVAYESRYSVRERHWNPSVLGWINGDIRVLYNVEIAKGLYGNDLGKAGFKMECDGIGWGSECSMTEQHAVAK